MISGLRVFGLGQGEAPSKVKNLSIRRQTDRRDALLNWDPQSGCQGYNILWGIAPDKLYSSWMVYGKDSLKMKCLSVDQTYYFSIEAFNENGVSERGTVIEVK